MDNSSPPSGFVMGSLFLALGLLLAVRWVAAPPTTPQTTFVPLVRGTPDSLSIPGMNAAPRP